MAGISKVADDSRWVDKNTFDIVGTRPLRPDGVDKVTGRAKYGADLHLPNMLVGKVLRSPHAHARIRSIDTARAKKLPGVKAVVTRDDFEEQPSGSIQAGEMMIKFRDIVRIIMAREKALFQGHPVAAVAAINPAIAREALSLIDVDYEVLPHVINVVEAMTPEAVLIQEDLLTEGVDPIPTKPSNVAKRMEAGHGDVDIGFANADLVIEREFNTQPVHQGYIEPHACVASFAEDGQAELWCSTQGHYVVRALCAQLLSMDLSMLRVTPSEIGGGFGGKTVVYLEPLALMLSRKTCQPVKMVMTRDEVFKASGPMSGTNMRVKIGATSDGRITAAEGTFHFQAGAFPGSAAQHAIRCAFAPYDIEHVRSIGFDVLVNLPKVAAYRAPGAPVSEYGVESVVDEIAKKLNIDPIEFRLKNAAKEGTKSSYGPKYGPIGLVETLRAAKLHDHYKSVLSPGHGRGVASGYWFNIGGQSAVTLNVAEDGTVALLVGSPDIGGSRASLGMMVAEELGIDLDKVRPMVADTNTLGYNFLTGGSRVTFATGKVAVYAARDLISKLRQRAAKAWDLPLNQVIWGKGQALKKNNGIESDATLSFQDLAKDMSKMGGPLVGQASENVQGAAPSFGTHVVDVGVDKETGRINILRYTVVQDAGRAIHPSYVEGQFQGGAVQGIGWALNEEYIYNDDGRLENPGFLDYRMPVCSDVPMIDTVIVEVPNPNHPYGAKGVGETPIVPPLAAISNAVENALGIRFTELPMSPPKVLAAIEAST
jgi:CO/xanthine dehydrogenase Mo-binding subunit